MPEKKFQNSLPVVPTGRHKELSLNKDNELFVFRYNKGSEENVLDAFIDMANTHENNFDWFDAAVLSFQLSKNLVEEADKLLCDESKAFREDLAESQDNIPWKIP
ncbi:MAG: hypothetical protein K9M57_05155 [Phycisphaerae bacterium]|nr:hypothetical protein [Phycisphaerae bacterium]